MAYIAHGIIKCTPFLSVGHRDNTLFYQYYILPLDFSLECCAFAFAFAFGVAIFCCFSVFVLF